MKKHEAFETDLEVHRERVQDIEDAGNKLIEKVNFYALYKQDINGTIAFNCLPLPPEKKKRDAIFNCTVFLSIIKDQNVNQCIFSPQGNHQSELIEHRISSIKVTALSKKFIITNHKSLL